MMAGAGHASKHRLSSDGFDLVRALILPEPITPLLHAFLIANVLPVAERIRRSAQREIIRATLSQEQPAEGRGV